jgi:peptidoglycan/xylan/chitin deacetylase (PgdA/CDA1 family)
MRPLLRLLPSQTRRRLWRLAAPARGDLLRWSDRKVGIALLHHRVGDPPGDPESELSPALGTAEFERQLERLASRHRVVRASGLLEAVATRRRGERIPVAITFDDDLSSHRQVSAPALLRHGLTATFFLSGASLERPYRYWWERLQEAFDRGLDVAKALDSLGSVPARTSSGRAGIHELSGAIRALDPAQRAEVAERLGALVGPDPADAGLRAQDVRWLADAGFELGFHTRDHHYLPNLDDAALRDAMSEGRDRLAAAADQPLESIAYPHGGVDSRVAAAARAAGFTAGFTTAAEATTASTDPLLIGRVDPVYHGDGAFAADLAWRLLTA